MLGKAFPSLGVESSGSPRCENAHEEKNKRQRYTGIGKAMKVVKAEVQLAIDRRKEFSVEGV